MLTATIRRPQPDDEDCLISMEEAARRLDVAVPTLKRMAQRGIIQSVKFAKLRKFEPRVIRAFIEAHRAG